MASPGLRTPSPGSKAHFRRLDDSRAEEAAIRARAAVPSRPKKSCFASCLPCCFGPRASAAALLAGVRSGSIAPLRGRWLVELKERGGKLRGRRDLPAEAFWPARELEQRAALLGDNYGLLFVALACPIADAGSTLSIIASCAKLYLGASGYFSRPPAAKSPLAAAHLEAGLTDAEVDFALLLPSASLHPPSEAQAYEMGVRATFIWLRHEAVSTWVLRDCGQAEFESDGLAFTMMHAGALRNRAGSVLDLSRRTDTCMRKAFDGYEWEDADCLARVCSVRLPVRSPTSMRHCVLRAAESGAGGEDGADRNGPDDGAEEGGNTPPHGHGMAIAQAYQEAFDHVASTLSSLDYSSLDWGVAELGVLLESLALLRALRSLDLSDNPRLDEEAAAALAACLLVDPPLPLQILNLSSSSLGEAGGAALAPAVAHLASAGSLTALDVSSTCLKCEGVVAIVNACQAAGCRLQSLSCDTNEVRVAGASALARMCAATRSLARLSLRDNLIKDEGALAVATILSDYSHGLRELLLASNGIGPTGAAALQACDLSSLDLGIIINRAK